MAKLIVARNPARKRRQTAKQRAASLRNLRKARAARRGGRRRSRRRSPRRRAARRRNPAPTARRSVSRQYNPRRRTRRRRNQIRGFNLNRLINQQIMPAFVGGSGAVANDVLYNFVFQMMPPGPMIDQFRAGPMRHVGKFGSALLLAWLSSFFLTRRQADQLGAGALTVVGYNVVREMVQRFAPAIPMGEYLAPGLGYYGAGLNPELNEYLQPGLSQIPGTGVEVGNQWTAGTPYLGATDFDNMLYDYEV